MKVPEDELHKVKKPKSFKYKVYSIGANRYYDGGSAEIGAINSGVANQIIQEFIRKDKDNKEDSWGYKYVSESDWTGEYTDDKDYFYKRIYYTG